MFFKVVMTRQAGVKTPFLLYYTIKYLSYMSALIGQNLSFIAHENP